MYINSKIIDALDEFDIDHDDGICYLISLYHGYSPSYIPPMLKRKINMTKIVEGSSKGLVWNTPLYDGQETHFLWVEKEYCPLFTKANPARKSFFKESTIRMKQFFVKNPHVRKSDVMGAVIMYLAATNHTYIREPHNFIWKGRGEDRVSDLTSWVEAYLSKQVESKDRNSPSVTMK